MNKIAEFLSNPRVRYEDGQCIVQFKSDIPKDHPLAIIPAAKAPTVNITAKATETFQQVIDKATDQVWLAIQAYITDWQEKLSSADSEAKK